MTQAHIHLLALPRPACEFAPLPRSVDVLHFERPIGKRNLRAVAALDLDGYEVLRRALPRSLRRLSAKGFVPGTYGWPRSRYCQGFIDWTIYGHPEPQRDTRSDHFVITRDFIAHGQKDAGPVPIIRHIATSRYGTPIYRMPPQMAIVPIYLRRTIVPPTSAHSRLEQVAEIGPQLAAIRRSLDLPASQTPELTWLPPENYPS